MGPTHLRTDSSAVLLGVGSVPERLEGVYVFVLGVEDADFCKAYDALEKRWGSMIHISLWLHCLWFLSRWRSSHVV